MSSIKAHLSELERHCRSCREPELSLDSLDAIRTVVENPEKVELIAVDSKIAKACREALYKVHVPDAGESEVVLVAIPKDIKVLSGYRSVDDFMSASIPVGFWQKAWGEWRGDMSSDLEAAEKGGGV